jgi:hypothetical protein
VVDLVVELLLESPVTELVSDGASITLWLDLKAMVWLVIWVIFVAWSLTSYYVFEAGINA